MIWLFFAALAAQPAVESPRSFLEHVYAGYLKPHFSPLENPASIFAPPLVTAIRKDQSGGEVGYLDGDPLCDCQDYEHVTLKIRSLDALNRDTANARVQVTLGPGVARELRLKLVRTRAGWRIADVAMSGRPSLLRALQDSNQKRMPQH